MTEARYPGAMHDLETLVRTHVFIIAPNNSGSTLLRRSFEISDSVWALPREGQHVLGFSGPHTGGADDALIWNSTAARRARYADPAAYDWEASRKAWYFQAYSRSPEASVFVTSSPPFLLNLPALKAHFRNAKFILLTRNPYAVAEGVLRRPDHYRLDPGEDAADAVARHIGHCLEQQTRNAEAFAADSLRLSYEQMCDDPAETRRRVVEFLPDVPDYTLDQVIPVKTVYQEAVRNMNAEAIARLAPEQIRTLTERFETFRAALGAWGYEPAA